MPAKDIYHEAVKNALIKAGWTITHDPLRLTWGEKDMYVDLGAEQLLGAEKESKQVAIEIKSFVGDSQMEDLEKAIGQYAVYRAVLAEREPNRMLYLAVTEETLNIVFDEPLGQLLLKNNLVQIMSFDPFEERVMQWIP